MKVDIFSSSLTYLNEQIAGVLEFKLDPMKFFHGWSVVSNVCLPEKLRNESAFADLKRQSVANNWASS